MWATCRYVNTRPISKWILCGTFACIVTLKLDPQAGSGRSEGKDPRKGH